MSGEFFFQADAIKLHGETAKKSGASIVVASGFDSIPFDLGAELALGALGVDRNTAGLTKVESLVTMTHGSASGGTIASAMGAFKEMVAGVMDGTMR